MFHHPDGRWIELILDDFQRLGTYKRPGGGVFIGADPACDVVIEDEGIEDFHAHFYGQGHHQYVEVISGVVTGSGAQVIHAGERWRGSWTIGGWGFGHLSDATPNISAIRTALAIADDAAAEGRHEAAAAILDEVGYRRVYGAPRTELPERLGLSQQIVRVRVENAAGESGLYTVGAKERLIDGITIGGIGDCDIPIPAAGPNRTRIVEHDGLLVARVEAGAIRTRYYFEERELYKLPSRWDRLHIGDVIVQLCRWPRRTELVR